MDGYHYARIAYEQYYRSPMFAEVAVAPFDDIPVQAKEDWKRTADAVLRGGPSTIPPPFPDILEQDPDSQPTPVEVPRPQRGSKP